VKLAELSGEKREYQKEKRELEENNTKISEAYMEA
jgi:hypothetical protein